jgi:nucleoid DNA-binding protein
MFEAFALTAPEIDPSICGASRKIAMPSASIKKTASTVPAKTSAKSPAKSLAKPAPKPVAKPVVRAAPTPKTASGNNLPPPESRDKTSSKPVSLDKPMLRARDLVARVAQATGAKVKDVRDTVEATLAELGKALDQGQNLQVPPLGKLSVAPRKGADDTSPIKLKLRRAADPKVKKASKKEALAEPDEAS